MLRLLARTRVFAAGDDPILITGERGTGKTTFARLVHHLSGRRGEFVPYQLSATSNGLHLNDLFGHARGAYTGAHQDQTGLVESARDGTLFLDEFGLASRRLQQALLSLFDKGGFLRLGEQRRRAVTARVVAATSADLQRLVEQGRFRRDLVDRLGYFDLHLPPLRERRDEIIPLFSRFWSESRRRAPAGRPDLDAAVAHLLLAAPWPGNVRQLEFVARYAAAVGGDDDQVTVMQLPEKWLDSLGPGRAGQKRPDRFQLSLLEANGNKSEAARRMGVSRRTIQRHTKPKSEV